MNRTSPALAVVAAPTPLEAARAAYDELRSRRAAIDEQVRVVEAGAQPAAAAAGHAQSLRRQKGGILARMLKLGRIDTSAPDVVALDRKLLDAEQAERSAAAVVAARGEVLADLEAQVRAVNEQLPAALRELRLAQFQAAGEDIRHERVQALRAAAATLGTAYAALAGAGIAHNQMARELREQHGVNVQALGVESPQRKIILNPLNFGISENGNYNSLVIDAGSQIDAATADTLQRWRR